MGKVYSLLLILLIFQGVGISQGVVTTSHISNNGQNGITFHVTNTTKDTITITSVASVFNLTNPTQLANLEVWYMKSVKKGLPIVPIASASGWIFAGSKNFVGTSSTVPSEVNCLEIKIPKDSTYGFWIGGAVDTDPGVGYMTLIAGSGINAFTTNGVSILTGDSIGYGGTKTGMTFTPRGFVGYINFFTKDSCSGKPIAGLINGPNSFCDPIVHCHSLSNASYATKGMSYNWYSSSNASGPYTLTSSGVNQSANMTTSLYYKMVATCTYSGISDTTPIFADTLGYQTCFCESFATSSSFSKIDTVKFLNKAFGSLPTLCETYTDNTNQPVSVNRNQTFTVNVKNGLCSGTYFKTFGACYIDWNKNKIFESSELIGKYQAPASQVDTLNYVVTVPSTAANGYVMMRILHYEDTVNNPCFVSNWGETEDYLLYIKYTSDIKMLSIENKSDCEKPNDSISFTFQNFGSDTIVNPSFSYSINGGAITTQTFTSTILPDSFKSLKFSTLVNYPSYGKYNIKVWSNRTPDNNLTNDTISKDIYKFKTPTSPNSSNITVCKGQAIAKLISISDTPFVTRWYYDNTSGVSFHEGDTFNLLNPQVTSLFYTRSVSSYNSNVGLPYPTSNDVITTDTNGIKFDVLSSDLKINTIDVYFTAIGTAIIDIYNKTNTSVYTKSFNITSIGKNTLLIDKLLSKDSNYKIILSMNPGGVIYTPTFSGFPMNYPGIINLKSSMNSKDYEIFYNWNVSSIVCASPYVPLIVTVNTSKLLVANLNNTYKGCEVPGVTLDAGNIGSSYLWSTNQNTKTINVTTSGTYSVTVTNNLGCVISDTTTVSVLPPLSFSIPHFITGCSSDSIKIESGFTNFGYSHRWSTSSKDPYSFDPIIYPKVSGKYYLTVLNTDYNCGGIDSVDVVVYPNPIVNLGLDTSSCNNKPITINAPTGTGYSYVWQDGSTSSSYSATTSGNVWVKVTDNNNIHLCKGIDTVNVKVSTLTKPNLGADISSCGNFTSIGVPSQVNVLYDWNNGTKGSTTEATVSGLYVLKVLEQGTRCAFSDSVYVKFLTTQSLNLGPDITACSKDVTLKANDGWTSYIWSTGSSSQSITVNTTGNYSVTTTNSCGTAKDTVYVNLSKPISVSLPKDTTVCNPITVSIPPQLPSDSIKWSTGDVNTTSITISQPGIYWVSVKNGCGTVSDAINVTWNKPPTADFSTTITGKFVSFNNLSTNGVSYFWDFGDFKNYSTFYNAANFYDSVKQYTVKLTVKNGCGDSVSITKIIVTDSIVKVPNNPNTSGIQSSQIKGVRVYPNPTKSSIFISTDKNQIEQVELYSLDGKKILNINNQIQNSKELQINLESFSTGQYILKIISGDSYQYEKIELIK